MKVFWKYIFPAFFGLIIYASIRLVNDTQGGLQFWKRPFHTNAIEIATVLIVGYLIQFLLDHFIRQFNKQPNTVINRKRILREFFTVYVVCALLLNGTVVPMAALTDDGLQLHDFVLANILPILYILLYFSIVRGNYYLKAYVDNKLQLEKITNDKLQTELKFLKAQYHPHFLFNALNTIYFQMDENVGDAKKSVEKFSELLRYQLYDQQHTVAVAQEINYLQNFIELQKVRSSDKLNLEVDFDPSLNGQQLYPLLFLPLVENAFKYIGGEYQMRITCKKNESCIEFRVINSIPDQVVLGREDGIGLENLKRRLQLLYPGKHELLLEKEKSYFFATLKLETQ